MNGIKNHKLVTLEFIHNYSFSNYLNSIQETSWHFIKRVSVPPKD